MPKHVETSHAYALPILLRITRIYLLSLVVEHAETCRNIARLCVAKIQLLLTNGGK
jgi:hypothetical protein